MSFKSKKTIVSLIMAVVLVIVYIAYATGQNAPGSVDIEAWAKLILIFMIVGVVAAIIIQVIFHIVYTIGMTVMETVRESSGDEAKDKEKEKEIEDRVKREISSMSLEDEMDKLISHKSERIGYVFAGVGIVAGFIALAAGAAILPALHIMLGLFMLGSIIEGIAKVYYYVRGVRNG